MMSRVDLDCFVGTWPFHYVRNNSLQDIERLHAANNIEYGFVSSTEAIFYNDPYEADRRLADVLSGTRHRHVVTINPTLPGALDSLTRMVREFPVAGVRILPGFHGYDMLDARLEELAVLMRQLRLPLFLTMRMEDERATYMFHPNGIPIWDVGMFATTHTDLPILICNARNSEVLWLKNILREFPNVAADCAGFKNGLFNIEELAEAGILHKLTYGSIAPVFCMTSSVL
ncbi:MAG: hypothetical protein RR994_04580 [Clostridia bacterium]